MEIAPDNLNNTRLELKRLAERGIRVETEWGIVRRAAAVVVRRPPDHPAYDRKSVLAFCEAAGIVFPT
ncbi:hypothetical protein AB0O75_20570 [Streptomyces sp. NPDC088921]|uniref:hypothetical protein n=1 Tax=unclassified Streptomyces TaxID=2593676 RepID=UPI003424E0C0